MKNLLILTVYSLLPNYIYPLNNTVNHTTCLNSIVHSLCG